MTTILVAPDGRSISHAARLDFQTANNASEYEALLLGSVRRRPCEQTAYIKSGSHLMAGHFDKSFTARDSEMARYLAAVQTVAKHFLDIIVQAIPRSNNEAADKLARMASFDERPRQRYFTRC